MAQVSSIDHETEGGRGVGVNQLFRFRARGSIFLAGTLGGTGILLVAISADQIPGPLATYIAGVGLCLAGLIFIIGWGGAAGQHDLARHATDDHQRMYARIDDRFGDVEEYEHKQCDLLGGLVDQVGAARRRRQI
jgi:hypothetical protein